MNSDTEETSLKQLFQSLIPEGAGVVEGKVTSANPLTVTLANDSKMVLSENSLIVPKHLTDYTTTADISGGSLTGNTTTSGSHTHDEGTHEGHTDGDGSHTHNGGKHSHNLSSFSVSGASITIHNSLKQGETVYLLAFNNGKKFYILDRKG